MNKTAIEWCDMTWNPVTGCYHDCPYCYARSIAHRFRDQNNDGGIKFMDNYLVVKIPEKQEKPFPYGFIPTLHEHRLNEPVKTKKHQNIFVCSMADLFGEWVPDEWIETVFNACAKSPQHRYVFLTKNPARYKQISVNIPVSLYFGASVSNNKQLYDAYESEADWISIEPLLGELYTDECFVKSLNNREAPRWSWVIIGAETGNRKNKIVPCRDWVKAIVKECMLRDTPVFMKDSLAPIWGEPLIREYPWQIWDEQEYPWEKYY